MSDEPLSLGQEAREEREHRIAGVEERGFKIVTNHVHPPIPVRHYDWCAYLYGYEEKTSWQGWGRTQIEAIDDLLDNLEF